MILTLKSDRLTVDISSVGAELQSIRSSGKGSDVTEYLWQGDPAWWGSRAPVLFPLIGMSRNGKYIHEGKTYDAPRHGFVRSAYFHIVNRDEKSITLEYVDSPATRGVFPFKFTFQVKFELDEAKLTVINRVFNRSGKVMPFCLGSHEAYNCSGFTDHYLEFDCSGELKSETVNLSSGLLSAEQYTVIKEGNLLSLDYSLFDKDTLVFKNVPGKKVSLKSKKSSGIIEVTYDAPNLAIWTKPGAPYLCIEPWHGLPGYADDNGVLAERPGAVTLQPGGEFVSTHSIMIKMEE